MVCFILVFLYVIKEASKFVVTFLLFSFFFFFSSPPSILFFLSCPKNNILQKVIKIFLKLKYHYSQRWNNPSISFFSSPKSDRCISTVIHFRKKIKAIICFPLWQRSEKKKPTQPIPNYSFRFLCSIPLVECETFQGTCIKSIQCVFIAHSFLFDYRTYRRHGSHSVGPKGQNIEPEWFILLPWNLTEFALLAFGLAWNPWPFSHWSF